MLETKVAKIPLEVRFFKSLASVIEKNDWKYINQATLAFIYVNFDSKILKKMYTSTYNSDSTYNS